MLSAVEILPGKGCVRHSRAAVHVARAAMVYKCVWWEGSAAKATAPLGRQVSRLSHGMGG